MKLKVLIFLILLSLSCVDNSDNNNLYNSQSSTIVQTQTSDDSSNLEGIYEFISETENIVFPELKTKNQTNEEWKGIWFFKNGNFSKTIMKIKRPEWTPSRFPSNAQETGFDGVSGIYRIESGEIKLKYEIAFYPGRVFATENFSYTLEKDTLTLTRNFGRTRENDSEGNQIIVLKKLR